MARLATLETATSLGLPLPSPSASAIVLAGGRAFKISQALVPLAGRFGGCGLLLRLPSNAGGGRMPLCSSRKSEPLEDETGFLRLLCRIDRALEFLHLCAPGPAPLPAKRALQPAGEAVLAFRRAPGKRSRVPERLVRLRRLCGGRSCLPLHDRAQFARGLSSGGNAVRFGAGRFRRFSCSGGSCASPGAFRSLP